MIRPITIQREIVINLDGPDGNAYALIGHARNYLKQMGFDKEYIDKIVKEMMVSNYEHLVSVFDRELGSIIILETSNKELIKCKD